MSESSLRQLYGEGAKTSVGVFWKAGWAFVLGYAVSTMIPAFVPQKRLTAHMGAAVVAAGLVVYGLTGGRD
jgi:uncharacterized protein